MSMITNIIKIYLNSDKTVKKAINPFVSRGANFTVPVIMVGPFNNQDSQYANFDLPSKVEIETKGILLQKLHENEFF